MRDYLWYYHDQMWSLDKCFLWGKIEKFKEKNYIYKKDLCETNVL